MSRRVTFLTSSAILRRGSSSRRLPVPSRCAYHSRRVPPPLLPTRPWPTARVFTFAFSTAIVASAAFWFVDSQTRLRLPEVECEAGDGGSKKVFDGWKSRKVGRYENRLRVYSHPLKVFKYFSSVTVPDASSGSLTSYMTPQDFVRSLVPYNEIEGVGETEDGPTGSPSGRSTRESPETREAIEFFRLADTDGDGLISYPEYLFFLGILSIPESQFDLAFKVFDADQNGSIDFNEFSKFLAASKPAALSQIGARETLGTSALSAAIPSHQNQQHQPPIPSDAHNRTNTASPSCILPSTANAPSSTSLGIFHYLFGPSLDRKLGVAEFKEFLASLRKQILKLEFFGSDYAVDRTDSSISARDFACIVVSHADYKETKEYAKRVAALKSTKRVTYAEFLAFDKMLQQIDNISMAIRLATHAGYDHPDGFTSTDLSRAIKSATDTQLSDTQLEIIYHIFDKNGDGRLDGEEFLGIMKRRRSLGLDQPRTLGLWSYLRNVYNCITNPKSE